MNLYFDLRYEEEEFWNDDDTDDVMGYGKTIDRVKEDFKDLYNILYGKKQYNKVDLEVLVEKIMYDLEMDICDSELVVEHKKAVGE